MPLIINTRSYTVDNVAAQAVTYRDPSATALLPSSFRLARTDPKPTANFPGVSKAEAKVTKRVAVNGATWPALLYTGSSIPAGIEEADLDLLIADYRSYVASTAFAELIKGGKIYHA